MKLTEFNMKPKMMAKKALKENFNTELNLDKLSMSNTRTMLSKIRGLMKEAQQANATHRSEQDPAYLKLMFMEQALQSHYVDLRALPINNSRIVVEAEGVQQAQVVLAAKDMVDSIQKMIEEVSDMLVKELPAVMDSIDSEIGVDAGEQFNQAATEALSGLGGALQNAKVGLQGALNIVTGQGASPEAFGGGMGAELAEPAMGGEEEMSPEMGPELPGEEEELGASPALGRGKR